MNAYLAAAAVLVVGWSTAAAAGSCSDAATQAREKVAVRKVEDLVANATTVASGLSTFDKDAVQDDFFGPQRHGTAEIAKDFGVYMDHWKSFHADMLDIQIDVQCNLAVAYSHQHFTAAGQPGKPGLNATVRQTDVLHKENGKWQIVYQHLSLPIDIDTGKPVMNP